MVTQQIVDANLTKGLIYSRQLLCGHVHCVPNELVWPSFKEEQQPCVQEGYRRLMGKYYSKEFDPNCVSS